MFQIFPCDSIHMFLQDIGIETIADFVAPNVL